jgi:carbon monoxide dehydrogenase subunit G
VPGCRSVETIDASHYRAVVEVSLGPIRTEFNLVVTVVEERPPDFVATMTRARRVDERRRSRSRRSSV